MIAGIGIDICSVDGIESLVETSEEDVLLTIFTPSELERFKASKDPFTHLAGVFAAKEAIFKACGIGWDSGVSLAEIEIASEKTGKPYATLSGRFAEVAGPPMITISHDAGVAVAVAVLERD